MPSSQRRAVKEIAATRKAYEAVKEARQMLETNSNDADANLALGRFYALARGDWDAVCRCWRRETMPH